MSRGEMFKTISFRLNLNNIQDLRIYNGLQEIEESQNEENIFRDKSKFIKFLLDNAFKDEIDFNNAKHKIERMEDNFLHFTEDRIKELVQCEIEKLEKIISKDIELAVSKGITDAVLAIMSNEGVVVSKENKEKTMSNRTSDIGKVPESGGELPGAASDFLDSL